MGADWTAEVTNDPDNDYDLYIELLEEGEFRGKIFRDASGELVMHLYEDRPALSIPLEWLLQVAESAKRDLKTGEGTE